MYLFDTDTLSNIIKKRPSEYLLHKIENMPMDIQFTTSINLGEIYYGAFKSPKKDKILDAYEMHVFPKINILFFDDHSAKIYGKTKALLKKKGVGCCEPDLRIAAVALQHKLTLITGNTAHFKSIPKLKIENWIKYEE
ncbi:MAG: type II toxin-antitoxin system VapC family toxin [Candidatus Aminicenantes bacterium]|nr:type II toxin-antitoxin system VapC family toxin [Candidatus Aminicenantes bacterium]